MSDRRRFLRTLRALALGAGALGRLHGCYPLGYNGACQCPTTDAGPASYRYVHAGPCGAEEADAGCRHYWEPAGPHLPPALDDDTA